MNPREAQLAGQKRQTQERERKMRNVRASLDGIDKTNMSRTLDLRKKQKKLIDDYSKLLRSSGVRGMNSPMTIKKLESMEKEIRNLNSQIAKLNKESRQQRNRNVARQTAYNKGGYAKCGASNPPSKKR